jgi:NADH-quinone oxidoreductase subunit J
MEPLLTIQTPETVLFWFLAPLSVLAALGMLLV